MTVDPKDRPILYEYFQQTANVLLSEYERSKMQNASDNKGKNRESFCKNFLSKILPPKLNVTSGEIWDSQKNKTGQLDTIILREDGPALHMGSEDIFIAEGVFAVIEIKSNLTREKLKECGNGFIKLKNLKINPGLCLTSGMVIDRPLRIVFAYEGASWDTLIDEIRKNGWEDLFDLICILKNGVIIKKGLLLSWDEELPFSVVMGKAASLSIMYYYLVTYGSSFMGRCIQLNPYFEPFRLWNENI